MVSYFSAGASLTLARLVWHQQQWKCTCKAVRVTGKAAEYFCSPALQKREVESTAWWAGHLVAALGLLRIQLSGFCHLKNRGRDPAVRY